MKRYEKYKDSGVEWIGEIPEGWNIKKLKYVLSDRLKYGANESALFENRDDPRYTTHIPEKNLKSQKLQMVVIKVSATT